MTVPGGASHSYALSRRGRAEQLSVAMGECFLVPAKLVAGIPIRVFHAEFMRSRWTQRAYGTMSRTDEDYGWDYGRETY